MSKVGCTASYLALLIFIFRDLCSIAKLPHCQSHPCCRATEGEVAEGGLVHKEAFIESVASISEATSEGQPLPTSAYVMVFPIIRAVLSWPIPSPLHEPALSALALHVSPSVSLPRTSMLALLYQVLEIMPAYR